MTDLSVVMPTYNGERYLERALASIVAQSGGSPEVIVVDDGSSDATVEIARGFATKLDLRVLQPQSRRNWVAMTNVGLGEARRTWTTVLHQDDAWVPGRTVAITPRLSEGTDIIMMQSLFVDVRDRILGEWRFPRALGDSPTQARLRSALFVQNWVAMPSVIFRTDLARALGGFDESLWYTADWKMWLGILAEGEQAQLVRTIGARFRIHNASQTVQGSRSYPDFLDQMTSVQESFADGLPAGKRRRWLAAGSLASELNAQLASLYHGTRPWPALARVALLTSSHPLAAVTMLRNSSITDRVGARVRMAIGARRGGE